MLYFVIGSILCIGCCAAPPKLVCCRNIGRLEGHLPPHRNYLFPDELIEISVHLCTPLCASVHTALNSHLTEMAVHPGPPAWPGLASPPAFWKNQIWPRDKDRDRDRDKDRDKDKDKNKDKDRKKDRNTRTLSSLASSSAFLRELALPSGFRYNMKGKTCKCEVLLFIGEVVFN